MSDDEVFSSLDPGVEFIARQLNQLSPDDRELVLGLVNRLLGNTVVPVEYPPDVPFMNFDE